MIGFVIILISKVVNKDLKIIHDYEKNLRYSCNLIAIMFR